MVPASFSRNFVLERKSSNFRLINFKAFAMKNIHFLLVSLLALSSCSTYKNSQTPDDVYYSPGTQKEGYTSGNQSNSDYYSTPNDQYVHLRVQDPSRWSYFDDYNTDYYGGYSAMGFSPYYGYNSYGFGLSPWIGFGYYSPLSYWNSYYSWNSFYNPYYGAVVIVNPKIPSSGNYTRLGTFNPGSYSNRPALRGSNVNRPAATASNSFTPYNYSQTIRSNYSSNYSNNNRNLNSSNFSNRPITNSSQPTRSYTPSSSFGGSSGGGFRGGGGGGGASRPGR
jgi:hypothetical protein